MIVTTEPFPHIITDKLFDREHLDRVLREFPHHDDDRWRRYGNTHEGKYEGPHEMWGPFTTWFFDEMKALAEPIGDWFGIPGLTLETIGGGYHLIPPGGHLDVHVDFNRSPESNLFRRINCLTYLNRNWKDEGGHLELWDETGPSITVAPEFGTTVLFATSDHSWHGHPHPAKRWRASVAGYYFAPDQPDGWSSEHSTVWR